VGARRRQPDVPDTKENDAAFGRSTNGTTTSAFPQVRLVALGECGTHAAVDAEFAGVNTGEQTLAEKLISRFTDEMLVLADRNFYSCDAWHQACATGAALLWRLSSNVGLLMLGGLPDGSYRSVLINPKIRGRRREALLAAARAGRRCWPPPAPGNPWIPAKPCGYGWWNT